MSAVRACAVVLALCLAAPASGKQLVADLSSGEIAITMGFTGTELLLFGATEGMGDVVVVVRGPMRREVVRRKTRIAGIWVNGASITFDNVPAFYWVAATRPPQDVAGAEILRRRAIGAHYLDFAEASGRRSEVPVFREALLRNKRRAGLYGTGEAGVRVIGGRLFRTTVNFPATVPTGRYSVEIYLFRDGAIVGAETRTLDVRKVGIEAEIFNFAHEKSALYGIISVMIALAAGWLAGVIFRST